MRGLLTILMATGVVTGLSTVSAAEPLEVQGSSSQHLSTAASPEQSAETKAMVRTTTPAADDNRDCEEVRSSNARPPTMLSRFARSSSSAPDVQCPIPTVDGLSTQEELHP